MTRGKKNIALLVLIIMVFVNFAPSIKVNAEQAETSTPIVADEVVFAKVDPSVMADCYGVKAPTINGYEGYYFGGWFSKPNNEAGIKTSEKMEELVAAGADVYAKFVPSYMLNVKAQNASNLKRYTNETTGEVWATAPENKTSIRMISAVDCVKYKEVGFHVFVNGTRVNKTTWSKYNETVYDKIVVKNNSGETVQEYTAKQLFGLQADNYNPKLMIAKFINIPEKGWKTSIYIRPYWITFDGIEVRGNGKYLHVEDGIKGYVSVPINLQSLNNNTTGIAAGKLEVDYDKTKLTFIDSIEGNKDLAYKAGGVFDTAGVRLLENGRIRCVALKRTPTIQNVIPNEYAATLRQTDAATETYRKANDYGTINNMYVTLRFKPTSEYKGIGDFVDFDVKNIDFCDTDERDVSVSVWNSRY